MEYKGISGSIYQGISGSIYQLEEKDFAGGGEGKLYKITNCPNHVAKIFKEERRTDFRETKLRKMVQLSLSDEQLLNVAWPRDIIYDRNGFAGYIMPLLENNRNLNMVYATGETRLDYRHRILIAHNLCVAVETIHSLGQVCGDLNPQNIGVNLNLEEENAFRVTLVDADSYHFWDSETDKIYRCEVGLSEYIAPELQHKLTGGKNLKNADLPTYTKETDLFALAVHIFALLMNGCHPFACAEDRNGQWEEKMEQMTSMEQESVVLPQPIDNIKTGFFPFHQKREHITYPMYAPDFQSLPVYLQELFVRTFEEGYENPKRRVSASEWRSALKRFATSGELVQCEKKHWHAAYNTTCPWCDMEKRMEAVLRTRITAGREDWESVFSSEDFGKQESSSESGSVLEEETSSRSLERGWGLLQFFFCVIHWFRCVMDHNYPCGGHFVPAYTSIGIPLVPTAICILSVFTGMVLWQRFDKKPSLEKWCRFFALLWFAAILEILPVMNYDAFKGAELLGTFFITSLTMLTYESGKENKC